MSKSELQDYRRFVSGKMTYKGRHYEIKEQNGKLFYFEEMPDGSLVADYGIEDEMRKVYLKDKIYNKIDNYIRKLVFNHSFIPDPDIMRVGNLVFVDKASHLDKKRGEHKYEYSHRE